MNSFFDEIRILSNHISPFSSFSNPAIVLNIVVFPTPDGPRMDKMFPLDSILKLMLKSLWFLLDENVTFFTSKKILIKDL